MDIDLHRAMEVARTAADAAGAAALAVVRAGITVEWKADQSPVTAGDRDAEAAVLRVIREAFPDHGVVSEECGSLAGDGVNRWIVDPIDGTRGFARSGVFWGPLIALEHRGAIVAGALALPALGETYAAARGLGCWRNGVRTTVSAVTRWSEATLSIGELSRLIDRLGLTAVLELVRSAVSTRCYGDVGSAAMLLAGRADAWIEAGVAEWDIAPQKILVEEAGGRITELPPVDGKRSVVATNGHLHDHVLGLLRAE